MGTTEGIIIPIETEISNAQDVLAKLTARLLSERKIDMAREAMEVTATLNYMHNQLTKKNTQQSDNEAVGNFYGTTILTIDAQE